eukprot:376769-Amphidinium_carterae.3
MLQFNLRLNTKAGKTEVSFCFRRHSSKIWSGFGSRFAVEAQGTKHKYLLKASHTLLVGVTVLYRYLGCLTSPDGKIENLKSLQHGVPWPGKLVKVVKTYSHSRLLHGVAAVAPLSAANYRTLSHSFCGSLRAAVHCGDFESSPTFDQVLAMCKVPPLEATLRVRRLMLLRRVIRSENELLLAVLAEAAVSPLSWIELIVGDLRVLWLADMELKNLPAPSQETLPYWVMAIALVGSGWKSLLQKWLVSTVSGTAQQWLMPATNGTIPEADGNGHCEMDTYPATRCSSSSSSG